jgi:hypothetical protein
MTRRRFSGGFFRPALASQWHTQHSQASGTPVNGSDRTTRPASWLYGAEGGEGDVLVEDVEVGEADGAEQV